MSYNGSGVYTLPGAQLVNGATVSATENNQFRNDVATALNVAWTRDGQAPATNDIPMGSNKLTELAQPTTEGDALAFGKNATVDDLAVTGTASLGGEYLTPYTGFKNRIINGAMGISQRGTSFATPSSGSYTLDRWSVVWGGAAPASVVQVAGPTGFRNALQITGAAGNTTCYISQKIESYNCFDLSGATISIQANISVSSAQTVYWSLYYPTAQDNYATATAITSGTWSATTTATTFSATVAGLPSGVTNGLALYISPANGGAFTSGTMTITGVQLEKGSTATSFDYRPYGTELALCQRYYEKCAVLFGTAAYSYTYNFKVNKRSSPTISVVVTNGSGGSYAATGDDGGTTTAFQNVGNSDLSGGILLASAEL